MLWRFLLVLVVVGAISLGTAHSTGKVDRANPDTSAAALARLLIRPVPERNLYVLTDQLRLRPPRPIPHVVRTVSPNYPVGHQDQFYVLGEDQNRYFTVEATIRAETPHLYFYVQNGLNVDLTALRKATETFERSTYPTDRAFFGSEWRPGIDGDVHLTCLMADLKSSGVGGYFSAEDEYPRLVNPHSNEREMFYIDSGEPPGNSSFDSILAHEFQHMIHFHMHPHENLWLNEGMSMLAEKVNGYAPISEPDAFVSQPDTQLDTFKETASADIPYYGAAYLFLSYLYERYGRGMIRDIVADKQYTDFELINDVLRERHIDTTADQLFRQWVVANYVDDKSIAGGIYGYGELPHQVDVQKTTSVPFTYHGNVPPYAAQYVVLSGFPGQKPFHLDFSAPTTVPAVSVQHAEPFWWSMRGDMMDTRLERTVDLTRVHHATLHFQTWYDIEKNYDYGYVEASLDGGKTWDTLRGTDTTTFNPNGASYGNGYTGTTKHWETESLDLSRYAGHRIELRFEYITDEGYNGQSWVVKDISIPEIGFRDDFTGWSQQGFVPISRNALPARWTVQLIAYTAKGIVVSSMPLTAAKGSMLIDPAQQGLKKLAVVVYTAAPKTTVTSPFELSAISDQSSAN